MNAFYMMFYVMAIIVAIVATGISIGMYVRDQADRIIDRLDEIETYIIEDRRRCRAALDKERQARYKATKRKVKETT